MKTLQNSVENFLPHLKLQKNHKEPSKFSSSVIIKTWKSNKSSPLKISFMNKVIQFHKFSTFKGKFLLFLIFPFLIVLCRVALVHKPTSVFFHPFSSFKSAWRTPSIWSFANDHIRCHSLWGFFHKVFQFLNQVLVLKFHRLYWPKISVFST